MKNLIKIVALLTVVFTACKNNDQFTISGKFDNAAGLKQVAIYRGDQVVDSAILNENGEFELEVASPDADFYYISAQQRAYPLIAKNGDELNFKADFANETGQYELTGTDDAAKLVEFNKISSRYGKINMGIQQEYQEKMSKNPALKDSLERVLIPKFEQNLDAFAKETIEFANSNQKSLVGFYALSSLDQAKYETELLNYAEAIKGNFPNTKAVQDFLAKMENLKALSVGKVAPDFQMTSVDGSEIKLSQLRGQYVLLDFWASWCAPCREENPNLVKQYNTFKGKNFTILGVSLDNSRDKWLQAIKDDNLAWAHVSELKQWDSNVVRQYNIEGIPASFLLDPQGKILAKNLRGAELEAFLSRTLN